MTRDGHLGQIVILNGAPRSGKTSIARAIQESFEGAWMNLGVDAFKAITPQRFQPGIGLRPGGERPDLEPLIVTLYLAMYDAIAAHSRRGVNVVVDVGHHDVYSRPLAILPQCAARLAGAPAIVVGVRCPVETVAERRRATWGEPRLEEARRFDDAVHALGIYDLELDTSALSPEACAEAIRRRLDSGPGEALARLAALAT